jgi:tyrosinase
VYGVPLIVKDAAGKFDPDLSNLVLALQGRPPFDGSSFPRMPVGYPQVPGPQIDEIRQWISEQCPP